MSPLNVHVTRYPIGGNVIYSKYHPGKYLFAWHPKASTENERTTVVISNNNNTVLFRQVAGAMAKRIVNYAKDNMIIDIYLPLDSILKVKIGERVRGGETIIAKFND
jgi:phosphatidylserine decarboxylase